MLRTVVILLVVSFCVSDVYAHSTKYPHRQELIAKARELPTLDPTIPGQNTTGMPHPGILSWHVHITYTIFNKRVVARAMALRDKAREAFAEYLGPDCPGRYDYGYLCMIADHDFWNPALQGGPFVSGEWSIFVPIGYYNLVVPWMLQNRGEFSMIVHPNTGYEYEDHSLWAQWVGQPWPLDLTIFEEDTQTNEFGQYRGDPDNPVCLDEGVVCGDSAVFGPANLCCFDLSCAPAETVQHLGVETQLYRCSF